MSESKTSSNLHVVQPDNPSSPEAPVTEAAQPPKVPKSYKVMVIADDSGKPCGNGLRFATKEDAEAYGRDLASRWSAVRSHTVEPSDDEPGYFFSAKDGRALPL